MYKYAVLLITLIYLDFFGILPRHPAILVLTDLLLFSGVASIFFSEHRRLILPRTLLKLLKYLSFFLGFYMLFTLIKGGVTLVDLYKMLRVYTPILLTIIISYDIIKNDNKRFYVIIFYAVGTLVTLMIFLIGIIKVEWFSEAPRLSYGLQKGEYDFGLRRVYMFSSFVMVIACFIYALTSYLSNRKKVSSVLLLIFAIGFLLQGYRSYIIATVLAISFMYFFLEKDRRIFSGTKKRRIIFAMILIIVFASYTQTGQGLLNRVKSGITDFVSVEGTFAGRLSYDLFRFKIFTDHPVLGIGLVHQNSERAQKLGAKSFEEINAQTTDQEKKEIGFYSLRSTDSGYLDILVQFGLIGGIIYYFIFVWLYRSLNGIKNSTMAVQDFQAAQIFIIILFITQISHSGFANDYGLVPLSFLLGFSFGELGNKHFNTKFYLIYEGSPNYK